MKITLAFGIATAVSAVADGAYMGDLCLEVLGVSGPSKTPWRDLLNAEGKAAVYALISQTAHGFAPADARKFCSTWQASAASSPAWREEAEHNLKEEGRL